VIHRDNEIIATVKLSRIDRNQVRLAFVADPSVTIDRQEKYQQETPCIRNEEEEQG
jgi:sRNA-binding carbon storage regulator CsrA